MCNVCAIESATARMSRALNIYPGSPEPSRRSAGCSEVVDQRHRTRQPTLDRLTLQVRPVSEGVISAPILLAIVRDPGLHRSGI
jgi:hypothetical protein